MDKDLQRIKIAEACGWIKEPDPFGIRKFRWVRSYGDHRVANWIAELPDYLNDLNAMHEAEKLLKTTDQQNRYYAEIAEITWGCEKTGNRQVVFNQLTATASQRAEAFLRTLGLWEGDE